MSSNLWVITPMVRSTDFKNAEINDNSADNSQVGKILLF